MGRILFALILTVSLQAPAALLSETIGEVSGEVFTSRQAQLASLMERILVNAKDLTPRKDSQSDAFHKDSAAVLLEAAVAKEAEIFSLTSERDAELNELIEKTQKHLRSRPEWKRFEFSDEEVRRAARQKLTARALVRLKSDSMRGLVSDTEARRYFEENRSRFGSSTSFESFRDQIKSVLAQRQLDDRLKAWFEILRRKYEVHDFLQRESMESDGAPSEVRKGS